MLQAAALIVKFVLPDPKAGPTTSVKVIETGRLTKVRMGLTELNHRAVRRVDGCM